MAGTYYYDVMKEHSVPAKKVMAESTVHGIATEHQVNEIVSWIEKYNENKPPTISSQVLMILVGLILFTLFLLAFSGGEQKYFLDYHDHDHGSRNSDSAYNFTAYKIQKIAQMALKMYFRKLLIRLIRRIV